MLLAIDTSTGTGVAVVDLEGGILAEEVSTETRAHAEVIGDLIRSALATAGVAPVRLSGVAVGMGPGPFTGLRVGIAAARAFAAGIHRPVVPIASHDAVALGRDQPTLVVTDARRRELAWSSYAAPDELGLPVRNAGPALISAIDIETVPGYGQLDRVDAAVIPAGALGMLAERLYAAGRPFAAAEPLYLRAPDVTPSTGSKRVTA